VRLRTPMMMADSHSSQLGRSDSATCTTPGWTGARLANPGPASYSQASPLTVTDCNVMVKVTARVLRCLEQMEICRWMPLWCTPSEKPTPLQLKL